MNETVTSSPTAPVESNPATTYQRFNPETFPCKCSGTFEFSHIDNTKSKFYKCDKCHEVKGRKKEEPPKCHSCELFYREIDANFDGCPYLSSNKVDTEECKQAYVQYNALTTIRKVHHKWFKYEDESLLDLSLAIKIHSLQLGSKYITPLWLFIVGVSGDRKSATIESFIDDIQNSEESTTYLMNYITPNTLATGYAKNVKSDLAPKLKNKLVITGDFAQFLKMPIETKNAIWSQFREAYEGRVQKKTGSGVETLYTDIYWDWLSACTPAIDEEMLMKDSLGTRELIYRITEDKTENTQELMQAVWDNVEFKQQRRRELREASSEYVKWYFQNKQFLECTEIDEQTKNKLFQYAYFITQLRASADCDWSSGELKNFVYPEKPTRILEQLKMLYACLKQLDYGYSDEDALKRILQVVKSSIHPVRLKILLSVKEEKNVSTTEIARNVGLAYATTNRELNICRHLGILFKREETGSTGTLFLWSVNYKHPIIEVLKEFEGKNQTENQLLIQIPEKSTTEFELAQFLTIQEKQRQ